MYLSNATMRNKPPHMRAYLCILALLANYDPYTEVSIVTAKDIHREVQEHLDTINNLVNLPEQFQRVETFVILEDVNELLVNENKLSELCTYLKSCR